MPNNDVGTRGATATEVEVINFNFQYDSANQILSWNPIPDAESYTIYHADTSIPGTPPEPIPPPAVNPPWSILCSNTPVNFYHVAPDGFKQWVCGQVNYGSWGSPSPIEH